MKILAPTPDNLARAAEALRGGDVVAVPTETVYGLAGAAFREDALARIFDTKERPTFDPLIVHVSLAHAPNRRLADLERARLVDAKNLSGAARERAEKLMAEFWPGPLTLVLPKHADVPDLATSGLSTVAIRMPRHPVAQALIAAAGTPLAAPSANRFGRISPTTAEAVASELGDRIQWIVDGGPCEVGLESTVLSVEADGTVRLLRPGGISRERIEKSLGLSLAAAATAENTAPAAPGMLASHYAPAKPLCLFAKRWADFTDAELGAVLAGPEKVVGILLQSGDAEKARRRAEKATGRSAVVRVLSAPGDATEAARNLFAELRFLDSSRATRLWAEMPSEQTGLFHAIADRLKRASQ